MNAGGWLESGDLAHLCPDKYPSWQLQTELEMRRCLVLVGSLHTFSLSNPGPRWGILNSFSPDLPYNVLNQCDFESMKGVNYVFVKDEITNVIDLLTYLSLSLQRIIHDFQCWFHQEIHS